MDNIEKTVLDSLSELTGLEGEEFAEIMDTNLFDSGILDSLSLVTMLTDIEDALHIDINIAKSTVEDFSTINKIIAYLKEKV